MLGPSKPNSNRVKNKTDQFVNRLSLCLKEGDYKKEKTIIQDQSFGVLLPRIFTTEEKIGRKEPEIHDKNLGKCLDFVKQSGLSVSHSFQGVNGNLVIFHRREASYCTICD